MRKAKNLYYKYWYGTLNEVYDHHRYFNIVLHDRRAIYFYIPKVACTAIKKVIAKDLGLYYEGCDVQYLNYPTIPHWKLKKCRSYFKFTFVRNPWDRLVSCYENKIAKDSSVNNPDLINGIFKEWTKYKVFYAGMSFPEFVQRVAEISDQEADPHFRAQASFFKTRFGDIDLDYVGRFENLEHDFNEVCRRIGLNGGRLERSNKSARKKSYKDYYDDLTRQIVAERYKESVQRFEYHF